MEKITKKEEEIMNMFWEYGPMFVRDIVEHYPEPKPHANTVSTMVRALESKGYVGHKSHGPTYQYYALVSRSDFGRLTLKNIIGKYFQNSYKQAVSALVDEDLSVDELKNLINQIERDDNNGTNNL
jgi:predicted transcriptional regulator